MTPPADSASSIRFRVLDDLSACRAVVNLQIAVWGRDAEIVPASVLLVSAKRGGILIGAFSESDQLIGFVWSLTGRKGDHLMHWSHMLGVAPAFRDRGVGEALKRRQREAAIERGIDLIEWTFDPLQAVNASLNLSKLGATSRTYERNLYGDMDSPLMRGTPTDRLVAEWWLTRPHVVRRLNESDGTKARSSETLNTPSAIRQQASGGWPEAVDVDRNLDGRRLLIPVPADFTEMQRTARDLALGWRLVVRDAFTTYFSRGYRAVDFFLNRTRGDGAYLLAADES